MNEIDICMNESEIPVKYGMYDLGAERDQARTSLKYIYSDMTDIKKGYFRLGFHLNEFRTCEYYKDFGYPTFEEFCEANFEMDKSAVSRCINVFLMTTSAGESSFRNGVEIRGCAMEMSDKYRGYSYSQLTEMLPLSEEQRKKVDPGMTVKQIRELKNKITDIAPDKLREFFKRYENIVPFSRENIKKVFIGHGKSYFETGTAEFGYDFIPGKVSICGSKPYAFDKIMDYYVECGGTFEPDKVATSQPEEKEIYYDSFQDEKFISDLLMTCKLFVFREGKISGHSIISSDLSGKRFSFQDADGNHYNIQYSVVKKKEG